MSIDVSDPRRQVPRPSLVRRHKVLHSMLQWWECLNGPSWISRWPCGRGDWEDLAEQWARGLRPALCPFLTCCRLILPGCLSSSNSLLTEGILLLFVTGHSPPEKILLMCRSSNLMWFSWTARKLASSSEQQQPQSWTANPVFASSPCV
jgi:hypothetical protein